MSDSARMVLTINSADCLQTSSTHALATDHVANDARLESQRCVEHDDAYYACAQDRTGQKAFFDDSIASKLAPLRRPPLISPLALSIVASIAIPSLYRSSPSSILLPALQTLHLGSMAVSELIRGATKHQLTDAYRIQWALTVLSVLRFALARSSVRRDPISLRASNPTV